MTTAQQPARFSTPAMHLPVRRLALLGCGLMGGSFAMALRAAGRVGEVVACSRNPDGARRAQAMGIADRAEEDVSRAVADADLVLVAVPVRATGSVLASARPHLSADALVMDLGSTKRDVVEAARQALGEAIRQFVPAHPIAGKELGGIENAEAGLYRDRRCILTPLEENPADHLARAQWLWESVGCSVVRLTPLQHDESLAAVSHLPHLLAFAYIQAVSGQVAAGRHLALAGPGFRDFSRIAAGTSAIWLDILSANRDQVLAQLHQFDAALQEFRSAMTQGDLQRLARLVDAASAVRNSWRLNSSDMPGDDPA